MKNVLLGAFLICATAASAQPEGKVYDFGGTTFSIEGYETPVCGCFEHVSNDGKHAVGYDEILSGASYYWSIDDPDKLVMIADPSVDGYTTLNDVSNTGIMVGSKDEKLDTDEYVRTYPATYTFDGKWTILPVPDNYSINQSWDYSSSRTINSVRAITPDGKYMAGQIYLNETIDGEEDLSTIRLIPVLWENGELKAVYDNIGIKTFYVWGISNDGSIIVGVNTSDNGGQNPAYIKDGQLYEVFNCNKEQTFNGGVISSIDADNNMYGYFTDDNLETKYFKYELEGDKIVYYDNMVICSGGGNVYGTTYYYDSEGTMKDLPEGGIYSVLDCSEDGNVLCGGGVYSTGFGSTNCPAIMILDGISSGIDAAKPDADEIGIDYRHAGSLYVNGAYDYAELYSLGGMLLQRGNQGDAFNMSSKPSGTYVVKVYAGNEIKTFKVMR